MKKVVSEKPRLSLAFLLSTTFAFLAFILIGANDGATGVLLPSLQSYYQLNKSTISTIFLFATAGYLCAAFTSGLITEKLGRKNFLLFGIVLVTLSTGLMGLQPPYLLFAALLFPLGFGVALIDTGLNAAMAAMPQGASLLNLLHAFYGGGALIGPLIASTLLNSGWFWNTVYFLWMILAIIVFVGVLFTLKTDAGKGTTEAPEAAIKGNVLLSTLKIPAVWLACAFLFIYAGVEIGLGSWLYSYLLEERKIEPLFAGWIVSSYWLGLTLGRLLMSAVIRWLGAIRTMFICMVGVIIGLILVWFSPWTFVEAIGFCLVGVALGPMFPTIIALMPRLAPARNVTSAIGLLASLCAVGGAFFPWLIGNMGQFIGLWTLLPYATILTILLTILWFFIQRYQKDAPEQSPT